MLVSFAEGSHQERSSTTRYPTEIHWLISDFSIFYDQEKLFAVVPYFSLQKGVVIVGPHLLHLGMF